MHARLIVTLGQDGRVSLQGTAPSQQVADRMLVEARGLVAKSGREQHTGLQFPTPDEVRVLGAQWR